MTARLQTLIGGRWRDGSGPLYSTEYPADGSVVAELHAASVADADEAVQAAEAARHRPSWAGLKPHQRALLLQDMIGLMERHFDASELGDVVSAVDKLFEQRFDALVSSMQLGRPPRGMGGPQGGSGHGGGGRKPRHLH